jgi:hypothetical protein
MLHFLLHKLPSIASQTAKAAGSALRCVVPSGMHVAHSSADIHLVIREQVPWQRLAAGAVVQALVNVSVAVEAEKPPASQHAMSSERKCMTAKRQVSCTRDGQREHEALVDSKAVPSVRIRPNQDVKHHTDDIFWTQPGTGTLSWVSFDTEISRVRMSNKGEGRQLTIDCLVRGCWPYKYLMLLACRHADQILA